MSELVKVIEEPAPPPRAWGLVAFVGGTFLWCAAVVLSLVFPDKQAPHGNVAPYMILPLTALFVVAAGWTVVSRVRGKPFKPAVYRRVGERIEFRFKHPVDGALLGTVLASAVAFIPLFIAVKLWGPHPWLMIVAPLPVIAVAAGMGYLIGKAAHARGDRDYVLEPGELYLPARRGGRRDWQGETFDPREIDAVFVSSHDLMIRTAEDMIVFASHPDGYTEGYRRGRWLAGLLGVPLLRMRVITRLGRPRWGRLLVAGLLMLYVIATVSSWAWNMVNAGAPASGRATTVVPAFDGSTRTGSVVTIAYDERGTGDAFRPPVLVLHGSPGSAGDLVKLCAAIRAHGYRVLAPDLPGFGDSTRDPPDLSILAHARQMLAFMDQLKIHRAHIIGWSLGGGVAMHMADLAPDRAASLTLMASVSDQSVEGTRSYFGEHAKYAAGYVAASAVFYGTPHFGVFGVFNDLRASMRNFWDTDLRPLAGIMRRLQTPTLILHGRHDFLVPAWNAEHSHELIRPSTLVITDHSHFYPFLQPTIAAAHMRAFLNRHDEPGVPPIRQAAILAPEPESPLGSFGRAVELALRRAHWLTLVAGGAMILLWKLRTGTVLLFLAVSFGLIDTGVALAAVGLVQVALPIRAYARGTSLKSPRVIGSGTAARTPPQWEHLLRLRPIRTAFATRFVPREHDMAFEAAGYHKARPLDFVLGSGLSLCVWIVMYFALTVAASLFIVRPLTTRAGIPGLALGILGAVILVRSTELLLTRHGRRRLRMTWTRLTRREYWPAELLYWPMAPLYIYWGLRYGPIAFTACNPGMDSGGGMIGESKKSILDAMPESVRWILRSVRIGREGSPQARAAQALEAITTVPGLAFPVILKPDSGYRGFAVKLARDEDDVRAYFGSMHAPAIVQEYHPGPMECGILWARKIGHLDPSSNGQGLHGWIFSITRKTFPILTGDGRRTLEDLIHRHERFHAQAGVFLERWTHQRARILEDGETLRLAESGNHCQGTLFTDGQDLITPDLAARIDALARSFQGGLDIGRFDLRYESDELLRRGEGFKVIELNGVTGESTNIYDPARSLAWAFGVAVRQWSLMYRLGAARKAAGHKPMPVRELFRRIREHKRGRSGSAISD